MEDRPDAREQAFERYKSRIGIRMTILYSLVYIGFVALSVFFPAATGARAVLGLNLAITYGLALIFIAIALAIVYNFMCRSGNARGGE